METSAAVESRTAARYAAPDGPAATLSGSAEARIAHRLLESMGDAVVAIDSAQRIVLFNAEAQRVFGYAREEAVGQRLGLLLPEMSRAAHREYVAAYMTGHDTRRAMARRRVLARRKDGSEFPAEVSVSSLSVGGELLVTALLRDVSEQAAAEDELKALNQPLAEVNADLARRTEEFAVTLATIRHGLVLYDAEQRLRVWNRRYHEIYGMPPEKLRAGMTLREVMELSIAVGNYDAADAERIIAERLRIAERTEPTTFHQRLGNGRLVEIVQEPTADGGRVLAFTDVTERERREAELRQARDAAEAGNRIKSRFLANMSHELRTPLNAIIGFSDILARGLFGPLGDRRYTEYAADIGTSARHLLGLLTDILDMAKLEAGQMALVEDEIDVEALLAGAVRLLRLRAEERGIELVVAPSSGLPPVRGDALRLRQILLNLITNAVKFTPEGGRIEASARMEEDGGLALLVRDTGCGIAADDLERVFQPFVQADGSAGRRHEGAGLGLSIARSLAELHGGTLSLAARPEGGTEARLVLPAGRLVGHAALALPAEA
jgi:PAS domain S-box-containing protein